MFTKHHFRPVSILFVLYLAFHSAHFAQAQTNVALARKFDEFGDILSTDIKARLDGFTIELQNDPNVRGFIIVYRSRRDLPGLNSRLARIMRDYLIYARGIAAKRVVTVDGGTASCLTQELWIVPVGATPAPRSDAYSREFVASDAARKFDEYYYYLPSDNSLDDDPHGYIEGGDSLDAFAAALRQQPRSMAYVIAYPQYYIAHWEEYGDDERTRIRRSIHLDAPTAAAKMLRAVRADLVNKYRIAPARVRVVNGGYRRLRQVELWLVPRGEYAPIATPNAFPKRRTGR